MSDERRQQEPTMEEILASIRRIISEDSRAGAGAAAPETAPAARPEAPAPEAVETAAETPDFVVHEDISAEDAPIPFTDRSAPETHATDTGDPAPLDLIHPLPPTPDQPPASPIPARRDDSESVLDLTNEVRDDTSRRDPAPEATVIVADHPERPTFLSRETHRRQTGEPVPAVQPPASTQAPVELAPAFLRPAGQAMGTVAAPQSIEPQSIEPQSGEPQPIEPHPAAAEGADDRLLSASTEAATVSALARLRQAAARQHEPAGPTPEQVTEMLREQVGALLDERFDPALRETLPPALAEHLPSAIREQAAPLIRERVEPAVREEIAAALDRRLDPMLREQIGPALRERLEPALHDRLGPLLGERLDPLLRERLDSLLRERLDPLLREWFDRNLPGIVERIVEREIERLVGQPGGN